MRLSISNLAWDLAEEPAVLDLLLREGVQGVEVAPTKLWAEWRGATTENARRYRQDLAARGLAIPALQAILFGKPECKIFGTPQERQATAWHLRAMADLAAQLGAGVLVLGAPKNRDRGGLSETEAFDSAAGFFAEIGGYCAEQNTCLCIEPNPVQYGCNFVIDSRQGAALVRAVNSPGFGLHLDAAGMFLAGEAPAALLMQRDMLRHFHISEPQLGGFDAPQVPHAEFAAALAQAAYQGWVSIEMRQPPETLPGVATALAHAKIYAGLPERVHPH